MKHAVIKTGGKQYLVKPGQSLSIEKIAGAEGDEVKISDVLLVADGKDIKIGMPVVAASVVTAQIEKQYRAKKILVVKYKPKVRYRKKQGHRQFQTKIVIKDIK